MPEYNITTTEHPLGINIRVEHEGTGNIINIVVDSMSDVKPTLDCYFDGAQLTINKGA